MMGTPLVDPLDRLLSACDNNTLTSWWESDRCKLSCQMEACFPTGGTQKCLVYNGKSTRVDYLGYPHFRKSPNSTLLLLFMSHFYNHCRFASELRGKTLGCDAKIPLGCDAVPIPQLWRECLLFNQIWYQKTSNMYEWAIWPDERLNIARRFGKKHIWKSKCTRHTNAGPLLEVHYVNSNSTPLHSTPLSSTPLHYTTLHHTTLHYVTLYSTALSYTTPTTTNTTTTTLPYTTLHYTREQLWVR